MNLSKKSSSITTKRLLLSCLLTFLWPVISKAQPGWQDHTQRYFYCILDEDGDTINFKSNKKYSIVIDSTVYRGSSIPRDTLKPAKEWGYALYNYIRINDLSLRIPSKGKNDNPLEIQIIRKKDTMFLNQPTGKGSTVVYIEKNTLGKTYNRRVPITPDRTLKFIPGYYYFPVWAKAAFDKRPTLTGKTKIINAYQHNFIVSKDLYNSIEVADSWKGSYKDYFEKADQIILDSYVNDYIQVEKTVEPTQINKSFAPFTGRRGFRTLYPTKDSNIYIGLVDYTLDTLSYHISKNVFSIFNKKQNAITHWSPKKDLNLFYCNGLYVDSFNEIIYQTLGIRDGNKEDCDFVNDVSCPYRGAVFASEDEGKNWTKDQVLSNIYHHFKIRKFHFLDDQHILAYARRTLSPEKQRKHQGVYYLIKNKQVIDSLCTPDTVHYNDNYNRHDFTMLSRDTAYLGCWGINYQKTNYSSYSKLLLEKTEKGWSFQIRQALYNGAKLQPETSNKSVVQYQNFRLRNNNKLILKNDYGTLNLATGNSSPSFNQGFEILENGQQIYLVNNSQKIMLMSFDGGLNWYVYPKPLDPKGFGPNSFLEIDENNIISFFRINQNRRSYMRKISYRFSKK